MRIAVTGADGFLGWHLRCRLKAAGQHAMVGIDRRVLNDPDLLRSAVRDVDAVVHAAGVNRADPNALVNDNINLAARVTEALDASEARPAVIFANSIHCGSDTPFGVGKQGATEHLAAWASQSGATYTDVRLPNLFGEHGRPGYNSVIATFCDQLSRGVRPNVTEDRPLPLLHVQGAAEGLLELCETPRAGIVHPEGRSTLVSQALSQLTRFANIYESGEIPQLRDPFEISLFNTLRSFLFPALYPIVAVRHTDARGTLFEAVRSGAGEAQVFCSTTKPGQTRGQHFHLRKIERFLVIRGSARISLRRLFTSEVVQFDVSGDLPAAVDMPTMWAHSITNTGQDELTTLFWTNELLNESDADTYPEDVEIGVPAL